MTSLTVDQAVEELEELMDSKPFEVLPLFHWEQENGKRVAELEAWILQRQAEPSLAEPAGPQSVAPSDVAPKAPPPAEEPVNPDPNPAPKGRPAKKEASRTGPTREERMEALLAKLKKAAADCEAAKDAKAFLKARNQSYQIRFQINMLAAKENVAPPALPPLVTNPWVEPQKASPVQALGEAGTPGANPGPSATPLAVATLARKIRREFRQMLTGLESLAPDDRARIREDLEALRNQTKLAMRLVGEASMAKVG